MSKLSEYLAICEEVRKECPDVAPGQENGVSQKAYFFWLKHARQIELDRAAEREAALNPPAGEDIQLVR